MPLLLYLTSKRSPHTNLVEWLLIFSLLGGLAVPLTSSSEDCACQTPSFSTSLISGPIDDCCCSVETVNQFNTLLRPILDELMNTTFFRYYKVNMWRSCDLWPNDGQCSLRECGVNECTTEEFERECGKWEDCGCPTTNLVEHELGKINDFVDLKKFDTWNEHDNTWTCTLDRLEEEADEASMSYIDLVANVERFTGYQGEKAHRMWRAIYNENCFPGIGEELCLEKRVFFRLISGLHGSISTHLCYDYLLDKDTNIWGPNLTLFNHMVGDHPERLKNLYFLYLFTLRGITKLSNFLVEYNYNTKHIRELDKIKALMQNIRSLTLASCPETFDESHMFAGPESEYLKSQFKKRFHNISAILDCVGCEKCKLWGKLQINGIGTALRGVFELTNDPKYLVQLRRTEIVAIINLMNKLSLSIERIQQFHRLDISKRGHVEGQKPLVNLWTIILGSLGLTLALFGCILSSASKPSRGQPSANKQPINKTTTNEDFKNKTKQKQCNVQKYNTM